MERTSWFVIQKLGWVIVVVLPVAMETALENWEAPRVTPNNNVTENE